MSLTTREIPVDSLTEGDLRAWRDLARRAVEPNPFLEPEMVVPAAQGLGVGGLTIAVVEDADGMWRACAPMRRVPRWRRLRVPCTEVWTHSYSGLEVPLVCSQMVVPALRALLDELRGRRGTAFVALNQIPLDGPVHAALDEAGGRDARAFVFRRFDRAAVRRRAADTYLAEGARVKRRRELERLRRRLAETAGAPILTVDRASDPSAVDDFLALEAAGWKGRNGTALASDAGHAEFFRRMCAGFSGDGRLQFVSMMVGERTVAMKCNVLASGTLFTFKQAYDEEFARFSPGALAEMDNLHHFHDETDAVLMDSMAHPDNTYINGLWPDRRLLGSILVPTRGPLGWVAGRVVTAAIAIRARTGPARVSPSAMTPVPGTPS